LSRRNLAAAGESLWGVFCKSDFAILDTKGHHRSESGVAQAVEKDGLWIAWLQQCLPHP